jgi:hypothetical protein
MLTIGDVTTGGGNGTDEAVPSGEAGRDREERGRQRDRDQRGRRRPEAPPISTRRPWFGDSGSACGGKTGREGGAEG